MEIKVETKNNMVHFNELDIGDCFKFSDDDDLFLRIQDYRRDYTIEINAVSLKTFDYYCFMNDQDFIKVDAILTIYKN